MLQAVIKPKNKKKLKKNDANWKMKNLIFKAKAVHYSWKQHISRCAASSTFTISSSHFSVSLQFGE